MRTLFGRAARISVRSLAAFVLLPLAALAAQEKGAAVSTYRTGLKSIAIPGGWPTLKSATNRGCPILPAFFAGRVGKQ
jgi:hypothetical protein